MDMATVITRQDLYEQVWSLPITKIAKQYGVSDSAIIKICKKMEIPRPGAGHWAKVEHGRVPPRVPLNTLSKSGIDSYELAGSGPVPAGDSHEPRHPLIEQERQPDHKVVVEEDLKDPHRLVVQNRKILRNAKPNDRGVLKLVSTAHFDLRVTARALDRVLCIMDALLKAFEVRGWRFNYEASSKPRDYPKMSVVVLDESIAFHIEERVRQVDHVLTEKESKAKVQGRYFWAPRYDHVPSGQLTLSIDTRAWLLGRSNWSDGKKSRVEDHINGFFVALIELAQAIKVERHEREEEERKREEERQRRQQLLKQRESELERRKLFEAQASAWTKAQELRAYIAAVEQWLQTVDIAPEHVEQKRAWILWAKNYANLVDPLAQGEETVVEKISETYRVW